MTMVRSEGLVEEDGEEQAMVVGGGGIVWNSISIFHFLLSHQINFFIRVTKDVE